MRAVWLIAGLLSFGLGVVGIFLPLLPTVPLILLAAFCFARSSERLHAWLIGHPRFGPAIADWSDRGAISRGAKYAATISIALAFVISIVADLPGTILAIQAVVLTGVLIFIWTRPDS